MDLHREGGISNDGLPICRRMLLLRDCVLGAFIVTKGAVIILVEGRHPLEKAIG